MSSTTTRGMLLIALLALWAAATWAAPATIGGRVIDAATDRPVAGANVWSALASAVTDSAGSFRLTGAAGDSINVSHIGYRAAGLPAVQGMAVLLEPLALPTAGVVVRAGLSERALSDVAASVSVLGARQLNASQGEHLQALLPRVPNLNWAGGTSRPRYFQIRGMGERSHYAGEGPPNFAVGFVLDDVDLSGLGSAGLLFDLDQVEVFRGPQSTIFGPNSMAGLISLRSTAPAATPDQQATLTMGNDALIKVAGSINVPLRQGLALRLGYAADRSSGFRRNQYLGRDDTNRRREAVARLKTRYEAASGMVVTATLFRADLDNGYDAWAPDSNDQLITYTDRPGADRQETTGMSLRGRVPLGMGSELVSITGYSRTSVLYSYDGDWGNDEYWAEQPFGFDPEAEGWRYDFFDRTQRRRNVFTQETRLLRRDAVLGIYAKVLSESDDAEGYLFGGDATDLASTFDVTDLALYGQYGMRFNKGLSLSLNLRLDRHDTAYDGATNGGAQETSFDVEDWLLGGKAALSWRLAPAHTAYATASRGYSAGGVNQHPYLDPESRRFDPEYVTSLELGYRVSADGYTTSVTIFHALRHHQQVDLSSQQTVGDPNSFVYYIANASSGTSSGMELEHTQLLAPHLRLSGSLGLLYTQVDPYTFRTGVGDIATLGDRSAAHAPEYMFGLSGEYGGQHGTFAGVEFTGMDGFYFSQSNEQRAAAHRLVSARGGYRSGGWSVTLWSRNLLDQRYAVRGFYFGLEPPNYPDRLYVTHGDPRQVGVTVTSDL
jgi:iron complex outermembrane recepter protein